MREPDYAADRAAATAWADGLLGRSDVVILDTETTGLYQGAEIVQLAVIDTTGQILLDTLIQPYGEIEPGAQRVHGIGPEQLASAPRFPWAWDRLRALLADRDVVIYNAAFDIARLVDSLAAARVGASRHASSEVYQAVGDEIRAAARSYVCAMLQYAAWYGDWSDWHGNYRYQRLPGGDHSALGDAQATLAVLKRMANRRDVPITVLLTPEEIEHWGYHAYPPLDETLQAVVADLLRLGDEDTYRRWAIDDWMTLYKAARGMFDRHAWTDGATIRARVVRDILLGHKNDPWLNARKALARLRPGKQTKAELEAIIAAVQEAMDEAGREVGDAGKH